MKKLLISTVLSIVSFQLFAQRGVPKEERWSPPAKVSAVAGKSIITIDYSQPFVKGRKIWGGVVPFDSVWRSGANEATTFETQKDIKINGQVLPAGKYGFFTLPTAGEWTIIFNKQPNQWGAFTYDSKLDQLRIKVKPTKSAVFQEQLTYYIENNKIILRWENLDVAFTVNN